MINDIRTVAQFRGVTFSNFKLVDAAKELTQSILGNKIEPACYWSAEFICSGHFTEIWDLLIQIYAKYIHMGNPKLAVYIQVKLDMFKCVLRNGYTDHPMSMRNNERIRNLFSEIVCVMCLSKKMHLFEIKIPKEEYHLSHLTERFHAPDTSFVEKFYMGDDPRECFIPCNEMAYHLCREGRNAYQACYWVEWLLEFECRNKYHTCQRRAKYNVDGKLQMCLVWLIWDSILCESNSDGHSELLRKIIGSLLALFLSKFASPSNSKRKKHILFFCVTLLTAESENALLEEMVRGERDKEIIANVTRQIDVIYTQIKKNEISPKTDYLFKSSGKSNLDDTIEKLEQMDKLLK